MTTINSASAQDAPFEKVKAVERQLDDVMELIDTTQLKTGCGKWKSSTGKAPPR